MPDARLQRTRATLPEGYQFGGDAESARLSTRVLNVLTCVGLTPSQTRFIPDSEWLKCKNFGRKSLMELRAAYPFISDGGERLPSYGYVGRTKAGVSA